MNNIDYFEFDLRRYLRLIKSNVLPILLFSIACSLLGIGIAFLIPQEYEAQATLIIDNEIEEFRGAGAIGETYELLIVRDLILSKTIMTLGLEDISPDTLLEKLEVNSIKNTKLMQVSIKDEDPQFAAIFINEIVISFLEEIHQDELNQLASTREKLQIELNLINSVLQDIENDLSQIVLSDVVSLDSAALTNSLVELRGQQTSMLRRFERITYLEGLEDPRSIIVAQEAVVKEIRSNVFRVLFATVVFGLLGIAIASLYFLFRDFFNNKIKDARSLFNLGQYLIIESRPNFDDGSLDERMVALEGIVTVLSAEVDDIPSPILFLSSDSHVDIGAVVSAYGKLRGLPQEKIVLGVDWPESLNNSIVGCDIKELIKLESTGALTLIGNIVLVAKANASTKTAIHQAIQRLQIHNKTVKSILLLNTTTDRFDKDMLYRITGFEYDKR